jgi:predicted RNA polymerase sigma factor
MPRIRALGAAARKTCERIDWSKIVAEFEQTLLELTAEPLIPFETDYALT